VCRWFNSAPGHHALPGHRSFVVCSPRIHQRDRTGWIRTKCRYECRTTWRPQGPYSAHLSEIVRGLFFERYRSRHLVPAAAVEEAARNTLADADHSLSGPLPRRRSPLAPLPKEERPTGRDAPVPQHTQPVRCVGRAPTPISPPATNPVKWLPRESLDTDRPPTAVNRVVPSGKGIKVPVASGYRLRHDPVEQGVQSKPSAPQRAF
jgi:hypothetical protein